MTIPGKHVATILFTLALTGAAHANDVRYSCDGGTELIATFSPSGASPGAVTLVFPRSNATIRLPQLKSADGARYGTRPGAEVILNGKDGKKVDATAEFWVRGRDATWTVGSRTEKCQSK
jgi:hypothetical protein